MANTRGWPSEAIRTPLEGSRIGSYWLDQSNSEKYDGHELFKLRANFAIGKHVGLAFWSIDCPPCVEELGDWGRWQQRHPHVPILLVSTDSDEVRPAINALLARHDIAKVSVYILTIATLSACAGPSTATGAANYRAPIFSMGTIALKTSPENSISRKFLP